MKRKKINSKGFTLVELLAVIAIMSLIVTVVVYTATNIVGSTKEKSYQVTINNIEKNANNYILEGNGLTSWTPGITSDYEYQCVTVQNLIDKDYFDNDVLEAKVAENVNVKADDLIYLERDSNNKTIIKNILLVNDRSDYRELCGNVDILANIDFSVNPSGWSKNKDVNIYYSLYNNVNKLSSYTYDYIFIDNEYSNNFNKQLMKETFLVNKNGTIFANIYDKYGNIVVSKSYNIDTIDNIAPIITCDNSKVFLYQTVNDTGEKITLETAVSGDCSVKTILANKKGLLYTSGCIPLVAEDNNEIYERNCTSVIYNEDGVQVDNLQWTKGNCDDGYCQRIYTLHVCDRAKNCASKEFIYEVKY